MLIGAFAALWIGMIPVILVNALLCRFVDRHSPLHVILILPATLILLAGGATWFKHLFTKECFWDISQTKILSFKTCLHPPPANLVIGAGVGYR